jgi:hypothetical protein
MITPRLRKGPMNILQAMADPMVFAPLLRPGPDWEKWRVFLSALFGLPMSQGQKQIFQHCTHRTNPRAIGYREAWLCCGRRALKSFTLAMVAVFLAAFRDWRVFLGPGEAGTIMIIAADRKQCRVILRYVKGLLTNIPMLEKIIVHETTESITLRNRIVIEVHTASFRSTRGYTLIAALLDEVAYWGAEESTEPDHEIISALRPGMSTIPGSMLLCASSPYARRGVLWDVYRRYYGKEDSDVLIWQAPTRYMNPSVPQREIDRATEEDPAKAAAEYGAEFRSDREAIISRDAVMGIELGTRERSPIPNQGYVAFVDPSGGSSDSFTLAIAHRDGDRAVLDCVREYPPPFSPDQVCEEMAALCHSYGVFKVTGDAYAKLWPVERFQVHGIRYEQSEKVKSVLYNEFLAILNGRRCELLDHPRLITQFCALERHCGPSGRDQINHPPNAHDDIANAVAGALTLTIGRTRWWENPRLQRALGVIPATNNGRPVMPVISAVQYAQDPHYRLGFFR